MNIHLLTTKKPTKLHNKNGSLYGKYTKLYIKEFQGNEYNSFHMYITSDDDIKERDWVYCNIDNTVDMANDRTNYHRDKFKKIILTTDPDLIKNGIQAIDDKFLEWFVKNPTCDEVEILRCSIEGLYTLSLKEKFKQETLEKAAERLRKYKYGIFISKDADVKGQLVIDTANAAFLSGMIEGAKWQEEKSYNNEDLGMLLDFVSKKYNISNGIGWFHSHESVKDISSKEVLNKWFEQFKKTK